MGSFNIVNLTTDRTVDLGSHLAGGWGPASLVDLPAGEAHRLDAADAEVCTYVISGMGTVTMDDHAVALTTGMAVTLTKGTAATVAAAGPMQLFTAALPCRSI